MSARPAQARAARTRARACAPSTAAVEPSCSISHSSSPGSTLPERVAITSPSSGVKPIVVSTRAAVGDRAQRRARAEVAADDPQARRAERRAARGTRCATHAWERPWKPKRRRPQRSRSCPRQRVGRRPRPGASRGTRCRSTRPRAATGAAGRPRRARRATWPGAAARARRARASAARTSASIRDRVAVAGAAVHDPVADGVRAAELRAERGAELVRVDAASRGAASSRGVQDSVVVVEQRELQAARPGVDDEDRHALPTLGRRRRGPAPVP